MKIFQASGLITALFALSLISEGASINTQHKHSGSGAALLVIDLQRGLFRRPTPIYGEHSLLSSISGLVSDAHTASIPVVFVRHSNKMLVKDTEPWELHPAVQPYEYDLLIDKTHGDAFRDTELDVLLRKRSVDTVYVTGLVTEGCVRATCLGALQRGYHVVLVADAHSSFHRDAANRIQYWNEIFAYKLNAVVPAGEINFEVDATNINESEQSGPGYPPQGVGSPDP